MARNWLFVIGLVLLLFALAPIAAAAPPQPPGPPSPPGGGLWHPVWAGETLSSIGWRYGANPYEICRVNGLVDCNLIYAGQTLWIPSGWDGGGQPARFHIVRPGETLSGIGRWYGASPWAIAQANGIANMNLIFVGQSLFIP